MRSMLLLPLRAFLLGLLAASALAACDDGVGDDAGPGGSDAGERSDAGPDAGPVVDRDAGPGAGDAGPGDDAGPPVLPGAVTVRPLVPEAVPEGRVPIGLAIGNGRIVTTCDRGRSVAQDLVLAADASDHHEYAAAAGGAFGDGVFVIATGWGYPGHVLRSEDGITWEDLGAEAFTWEDGSNGMPTGAVVSVFYDGTQFGIVTGRRLLTSPDGRAWADQGVQYDYELFHWRSSRFQPALGRYFTRGENAAKDVQWLYRSDDSAVTLTSVTAAEGFSFSCTARMLFAHGALLAPGGDNVYCLSLDGGDTWSTGSSPQSFGGFLPTDDGFLGLASWRQGIYRSADGETWTEEAVASSYRHSAGGYSPHGYYWLASHFSPELFVSDDGRAWTPLPGDNADTVPDVRHMVFGHGAPSSACPLSP